MNVKTFITVFLTLAICANLSFGQSSFDPSCCEIYPGDEIWLVSARDVDDCSVPCIDQLKCQRFCDGKWIDCQFCDVTAGEQRPRAVVYVHGYQTDFCDARTRGLQVYQNIYAHRPDSESVRFVIWAWKSERETRRPIKDFDLKSHRAVELADVFAATMNALETQRPVVIGYSLGAQVVVAAFARSAVYTGPPVSLVIVAAANDCGFASCPNQLSNCGHVEQSIIFCNAGDRAIRAAHLICKLKRGSNFRSFEELALQSRFSLGELNVFDISEIATKRHSIVRYTAIPIVQSLIQQLLRI